MDKAMELRSARSVLLKCLDWYQAGQIEYEFQGKCYPWNGGLACRCSLVELGGLMAEW